MVSTDEGSASGSTEVPKAEASASDPATSSTATASAPASAKADAEALSVATTASSEDGPVENRKEDSSSASQQATADASAFQFSTSAAEFVPYFGAGQSPGGGFSFQFNAGAEEFKPGPPSGQGSSDGKETAAPASPMATFVQAVPMGVPVYPVMAVQMPSGRPGHMTYVSPVSPVAHMPMGFVPNMAYRDGTHAADDRSKASGKGRNREGGRGGQAQEKGGRNSHQERRAGKGSHEGRARQGSFQKGQDENNGKKEAPPEKEAEEENEEEEEEDSNEPKKPSWADMAKRAAAKPAEQALPKRVAKSPADAGPPEVQKDGAAKEEALPKRVAKNPAAAPAAVVPKAVSWGPKAETSAPSEEKEKEQEAEVVVEAEQTGPQAPAPRAPPEKEVKAQPEEKEEEEQEDEEEKKNKANSWAARLFKKSPTQPPGGARKPPGVVPKAAVASPTSPQSATPKASAASVSTSANAAQDSWETEAKESQPAEPQKEADESKEQEIEGDEDEDDVEDATDVAKPLADEFEDAEDGEEEEVSAEEPVEAEDDEDDYEDAKDADSADQEEEEEEEEDAGDVDDKDDDNYENEEAIDPYEPDKPDKDGIIRYTVSFLKKMSKSPYSEGSCPARIPHSIRTTAQETNAKQRYGMKFLEQFKEKPMCQELPANHRIPKELRGGNDDSEKVAKKTNNEEDDWRSASAKNQKSRDSKTGKSGRTGRRTDENLPKLESTENSWLVTQKEKKKDSDLAVVRQMKSILNKLTVEKFDSLYAKLLECGISNTDMTEILMKEVFEKATLQHHFIEMYTGLCLKLTEWFKEQGNKDNEVDFRKILLNQCQDSFETYLKPPEGIKDLSGEEEFEAKVKYKTKMLGNMKFVGQLLINKALSSKILFTCTEELLYIKSEETLETLCAFLMTIGPHYDDKVWKNYAMYDDIFKQVAELSKDKSVSARIRCLLKDVIDLRKNNWQGHRPSKEPEGPKKMSAVKHQWEKDMAQQESRMSGGGGSRGGRSAPTLAPTQEDDEWETVPSSRRGGKTPAGAASTPSRDRGQGATPSAGNTFGALERRSRPAKAETEWRKVKSTSNELLKPPTPTTGSKGISLMETQTKLGPSNSSLGASSSAASSAASEEKKADKFQKEVISVLQELATSHDTQGALARVREAPALPSKHQKAVLLKIVEMIIDTSASGRPTLWSFLAKLLSEGIFQKSTLVDSLDGWIGSEAYEDIKMDMPKIDDIVVEECLATLQKEELLSSDDTEKLRSKIR
mmetsp:Transcript_49918/g.89616  ORF Transcript_49918/g.89616 Transcript_49918/m.89616 type:complete len:1255 (+) Transcript_49918:119-3883(+)